MKFSIIIVNYNSTKYIRSLVSSIEIYLGEYEYEIIIVDNKSPERDIEDFALEDKKIKFIFLEKNFGFGYANNRGMEQAKYDYLFLLNPDTYFINDSVKLMFTEMEYNLDWGIVGPMVKYENGSIQESARNFPNIRQVVYTFFGINSIIVKNSKRVRRIFFGDNKYKTDFLFGSCLLIRKALNEKIGGFDEEYFLFTEETDYCYRANQKTEYKTIYFPKSEITHLAGAITKKKPAKRMLQGYNSILIFVNKNYDKIYGFVFRMAVVFLFYRILVLSFLFSKEGFRNNKSIYKEIISRYKNNRYEINKV